MSTDFLFTKQSFIRGLGSIGNLDGTILFNSSKTDEEADAKAIFSDWQMVGNDIRKAINEHAEIA